MPAKQKKQKLIGYTGSETCQTDIYATVPIGTGWVCVDCGAVTLEYSHTRSPICAACGGIGFNARVPVHRPDAYWFHGVPLRPAAARPVPEPMVRVILRPSAPGTQAVDCGRMRKGEAERLMESFRPVNGASPDGIVAVEISGGCKVPGPCGPECDTCYGPPD